MKALRPYLVCTALSLAVAASLDAQAPVITPAGDPSIKSDTIYRLAVDSTKYRDDAYVFLLDDGVVRYDADGRGRRTYRQVIQILKPDAVERWAEYVWGYDRSSEKFTLNWLRVVRPDGSVISPQPDHTQESDANVGLSAPVYSDARLVRLTEGGVAVGTIVDWSYTVEVVNPPLKGDFGSAWRVTNDVPTMRSRFIVDVPDGLVPRVVTHNLTFEPRVSRKGGRRVTTWAAAEPAKRVSEPFMANVDSVDATIEIGAPITWDSIGHWVGQLTRDRFETSPEVLAEFSKVEAGAKTRQDSILALHRWVTKDFRYVSLSLGIGGYRPRLPAEVLQTRYGDCKDKAVLFIALARRLGLTAYPVVLSSTASANKDWPSIHQFDHMIAAVEQGGRTTYVDLTSDLTPYGQIPPQEQGGFALLVKDERTTVQTTLPRDPTRGSGVGIRLEGTLGAGGELTGHVFIEGTPAEMFATLLSDPSVEDRMRDDAAQEFVQNLFPGALGDSLKVTATPGQPAVVGMRLRVPRAVSATGATRVLAVPFATPNAEGLVARLKEHVPRKYWIDVEQIVGDSSSKRSTIDITLPGGWTADLPQSSSQQTDFASKATEYRQDGGRLRISRVVRGAAVPLRPDRLDDVITWLRNLGDDDLRFVVLHPAK